MAKATRKSATVASPPFLHSNVLYVSPSHAQERLILGLTAAPVDKEDVAAIADRIEGVLRDFYVRFAYGYSYGDLHTVEEIRSGKWIEPDPHPAPAVVGRALKLLLDNRLVSLVSAVPVGAVSSSGNADTVRFVAEASVVRCTHYLCPLAGLLPDDALLSLKHSRWPWRGLRDVGVTAPPRFYKEGSLLCACGEKRVLSANATLVRQILILFEKAGWQEAPVAMTGIHSTSEDRRKQMERFLDGFPIEILPSGAKHMFWKWRDS